MSRIKLADPEDLTGFLREMHDSYSNEDAWPFRHVARAFAECPEIVEDHGAFYDKWHNQDTKGGLESRLKELIRLRVATLTGCKTCRASRENVAVTAEESAVGVDDPNFYFAPRERMALQIVEKLALYHFSISDDDFRALKEHFSQREVLELLMMAGQYIGYGRMLAVLQIDNAVCPI